MESGLLVVRGEVLGEECVSYSRLMQKGTWVGGRSVEIGVTTHPSGEAGRQKARASIAKLEPFHAVSAFLRVF